MLMSEEELQRLATLVADILIARKVFAPFQPTFGPLDCVGPGLFQPSILPYPAPIDPISPAQTCSTCGIRLDGVMGYVCTHRDCPTGMGPYSK